MIKYCRVCGKPYTACKSTMNNYDGVFRWQEVSCSPECGAEYLEQVMESRKKVVEQPKQKKKKREEREEIVEHEVVEETSEKDGEL